MSSTHTRRYGSLLTSPLVHRTRESSKRPPRLNGPPQSAHRRSACTACTGPRDQRLYFRLVPDCLIELLLEFRDVSLLLEDQEDLLPPGSSDGEDLCSYILGVHFRLDGFQDLGVGLTVLRQHPDSDAPPGGRRALRHLLLTFRILRRGHRNALPFLGNPILRGRRSNPLLLLCQLLWGIF